MGIKVCANQGNGPF